MLQKETIIVLIDDKGNPEITVKGVAGAGCLKATKSLEEALGKVSSRKETADMGKKGPPLKEHTKLGG